jgi:ubiquinone/menaquinone biosynthesis C-methylase UbiE
VGWYDVFALTYDRQLEALYAPYRSAAVHTLRAQRGDTVLDLACGTGQSFRYILEVVGPAGRVIGVDRSVGMLERARRRVEGAQWTNVRLIDADAVEIAHVEMGAPTVDGLLIALGLTAMEQWEATLRSALRRVRPGGRCVIMDVYAPRRSLQTRLVDFVARADLSRRVWEPLAEACPDFERIETEASARTFGGTLFIASGTLPDTQPA